MAGSTPSNAGDRLTRLEADQGALVGVVEQLRDAIVEDRRRADQRFERLVETLDQRFKSVYARLDTDRRVPWAPVGLGITIILAAVSGWWALQSRDVSRLETRQGNLVTETHERDMASEYQRGRTDEHRERVEAEQVRSTEWMVKLGNQIYEINASLTEVRERLSRLEGHSHATQR